MTTKTLAVVVHLFGVIFWIGGTVAASMIAVVAKGEQKTVAAARAVVLAWATPGMLLAWAGGLTILIRDFAVYKSEGWMHAKLTLLLVLSALTGVLTARLRKAAKGAELKEGLVRGLAIGLAVGAALTLILALGRPF